MSHEAAAELSDAASELHAWKTLVESHGWRLLVKVLEQQKEMRSGVVCLTPLQGFGGVLQQEFFKGEISGLALTLVTPYAQLEQLEANRKNLILKEEIENAREHGRTEPEPSRVDNDDFSTG